MTKKTWTKAELSRLRELSVECPPTVIARELNRPVSSVRKKMREIGVQYVSGTDWRIRQINRIITDESPRRATDKSQLPDAELESQTLADFWRSLLSMARIAKETGREMDVLAFINMYRKISK